MKKQEEPKKEENLKLKVELSVQEWEAVLSVIEQSTSAYIQVKSITNELLKQLQPQINEPEP